ncbi:hypothetical protein [Burkholderia sp. Ac-20349]|uniref:hypothetical protein n=1 Tax=Burkholderia sp. Ac-20349 TaxID=2703893 RepID=UPI00197C571A|nr:hypothetical protein [Burkholderia sp. Ac-20349]MBN3841447.1 hypothetical protein [Burkholderia sp. Ac-20349]
MIPVTKKIEGSKPEGGFLLVQEGQSGQITVSNYVSTLSSAAGHAQPVDPKWELVASTWAADDWSPNENQIIKMPGETAMVFKKESIPSSTDKNFYQNFNFQFGVIDLANRIHLSDQIVVQSQGQPCVVPQ